MAKYHATIIIPVSTTVTIATAIAITVGSLKSQLPDPGNSDSTADNLTKSLPRSSNNPECCCPLAV